MVDELFQLLAPSLFVTSCELYNQYTSLTSSWAFAPKEIGLMWRSSNPLFSGLTTRFCDSKVMNSGLSHVLNNCL